MTKIHISDSEMSFKDLTTLMEMTGNVSSFTLEDMALSGDEDDEFALSRVFRGSPHLREFSLTNITSSVSLNQVVCMILASCPRLETIKLENAPITSKGALQAIGFCPTLKNLFIPNSNLKNEDAATVAEAAAQCCSIECIDISGNDLSDLGCVAFSKALGKSTSLRDIKLEGNGQISTGQLNQLLTRLQERAGSSAQAA